MATIPQVLIAALSAGFISSIQPFTATIALNASSQTATINSVPTAYSCIVYGGNQCSDGSSIDGSNDYGYLTLTNPTTVTATRAGTSGTINCIISGTVINWKPSVIKSIQSGTIVIGSGSTSNTATITSVTTGNSICLFNGFTASTSSTTGTTYPRVALTNGTTVTATRNTSTTNTVTVSYFIVEFASGVLNSSTQTGTITASTSSVNATITSVTTGNTWLIYNGQTVTNSGTSFNEMTNISLTGATTVTAGAAATANGIIGYTVCEFKSGNVKSNANGTITTTTVSGTATFTAVNTNNAWVTFLGTSCNTTIANAGNFNLVLTNSTTTTANRGSGAVTSATIGYNMMELTG